MFLLRSNYLMTASGLQTNLLITQNMILQYFKLIMKPDYLSSSHEATQAYRRNRSFTLDISTINSQGH